MSTDPELDFAKLAQPSIFSPSGVDLEEGKTYYYCRCGLTKNANGFCDGSHKKADNGVTPLAFTAKETQKHWICQCRQSANLPFCDGAHKRENGVKKYNEFLLKSNNALKEELEKTKKALEEALKK